MRLSIPRYRPPAQQVDEAPDLPAQESPTRITGELAIRHAHEHLALTQDALWAFYRLGGLDWPMRDERSRAAVMAAQTHRWSELAGKQLWIRGTSSPFPHRRLARGLYERYAFPVDPAAWEETVDAIQLYALANGARRQVSVVGVRVVLAGADDQLLVPAHERLADLLGVGPLRGDKDGSLERVRTELRNVTAVMGRAGLDAQPLRGSDLRWLTHASLGMGAPVPAGLISGSSYEPGEGAGAGAGSGAGAGAFTAPVVATKLPYRLTTRVRTLRDGNVYDTHVCVQHVESMEPRDLSSPDLLPFLAWTQTLENPVEYVAVLDIVDGRDLKSSAELVRRRADNIAEHHIEHAEKPPAAVMRGIDRAEQVEDEVTNAPTHRAARARGVIMLAVTGPDEESALREADRLRSLAASEQGMELVADFGQYLSYRAFTPGEPALRTGHVTTMPTEFLASGVPNATSEAGDVSGFMVGRMASSTDMLVFDPHGGSRSNQSNVALYGGDQGSGKSSLMGAIAAFTAQAGVRTVMLDPSGPWARLAALPYLAGNSRHLSLTGGHRGVLVPHLLVPEPLRQDYDTPDAHRAALAEAAAERMELCIDAFRDLLPLGMITSDHSGAIQAAITEAVTKVGGAYGTNPWQIVDRLASHGGDTGRAIAEALYARSELKDGSLIFPVSERKDLTDDAMTALLDSSVLTVVTMEGLSLPPKSQPNRSYWTSAQRASVPILNLASRFVMRGVYADKRPKVVMMDELGLSTSGEGALGAFIMRAAADSRKWNAHIGLAFQNPDMLTSIGAQISNLSGAAFIGRMKDKDTATSALPLLRLEPDSGYHAAIQALQTGEFLVRDWRGRVRKTRVDMDWWPSGLAAALDTNPEADTREDDVHDLVMAGAS